MIIEFLCNIFFGLANLLVGILPQLPSFQELNLDLSGFFSVVRLLNMFVDLKVVGICAIIILVVYNIKFIWSIFMWLIRKIPGVS